MKEIKIIFSNDSKRFGYVVDKTNQTYSPCKFDDRLNPIEREYVRGIVNSAELSQSIGRLIKFAIDSKE